MFSKDELIKENERLDDLHRNNLFIIQNPECFCFGTDAVLLSDFTKIKKGEQSLDLGTGNAIIPILLSAKTKALKISGLEISSLSADLAKRSVLYNNLSEKIEIVNGDIKNIKNIFKASSFDVVTTNPPYMSLTEGLVNENEHKASARHEIFCTIKDITEASSHVLKPNGRLYMVHRPNRIADIIYNLKIYNLEPKVMRFVHAKKDKAPILVLIESLSGGKPFLKVLPPLVIYDDDNKYTKEAFNIYYGDN